MRKVLEKAFLMVFVAVLGVLVLCCFVGRNRVYPMKYIFLTTILMLLLLGLLMWCLQKTENAIKIRGGVRHRYTSSLEPVCFKNRRLYKGKSV